jgi:RNA recognition motif-containing protein
MNLFVSNIDYKITEEELQALFEQYGEVKSVTILKDMDDQKPK